MQVAQQSFNAGFGTLDRVLQQQQAANQGVLDRQAADNTLRFKELVAGATPQQLAAMQASGQLDQLRAGMDIRGRESVVGAEEARAELLKARGRSDIVFDQTQQRFVNEKDGWRHTAALRPLELRSKQLDVTGKETDLKRGDERFGWERVNQDQRVAMFPLEQKKAEASIRSSNASAAASFAQAGESGARVKYMAEDRESAKAAAKAAARTQLLRDAGNIYAEGVLTPGSAQELRKLLTENKIGDSDAQNAMIDAIGKLQEVELDYVDSNNRLVKKKVPVPLSVAKLALSSASGGFLWNTDNDWAQSVTESIKDQMTKIIDQQTADGRPYKQNKAVFDFAQYMDTKAAAAENPPVAKRGR
jgi:hypothetical protein